MNANPFLCQNDGECKDVNINPNIGHRLSVEDVMSYIEDTFKIERTHNGVLKRISLSNDVLDFLAVQLCSITEKLSTKTLIPDFLAILLKSLRNIAATSNAQRYIVYETDILENTREIIQFVLKYYGQYCYIKLSFQFLINLISSNEACAKMVYKTFSGVIQECLNHNYHIYECSGIIYNISRFENISSLPIIEKLIGLANGDEHNEYIHFFMENMISNNNFWKIYKEELSLDSKVIILDFMRNSLLSNKHSNIDLSSIEVLSKEFIDSVEIIFQTNQANHNSKAYLVSLILQVLSSLSSIEEYLPLFQSNKDLFINLGVVLINIHKLGKISDNCFTPVQKLSEIGNQELKEHPAFGFKADLIRFVGNMCWKNSEMQNLARTAELIPLILDCCNMDGKNPFIIQWCILAIRNICDQNIENQKYIAGLHQQGTVNSATLDEMGITLHSDGENQLKIVSLNSLTQ